MTPPKEPKERGTADTHVVREMTAEDRAWKLVLFFKDHGAKFENFANATDSVAKVIKQVIADAVDQAREEGRQHGAFECRHAAGIARMEGFSAAQAQAAKIAETDRYADSEKASAIRAMKPEAEGEGV